MRRFDGTAISLGLSDHLQWHAFLANQTAQWCK
ncbi:hypothetical protein BRAS3843_2750004 [Bradyrhizobium sp. STM 3843]|nr:hypothetical protein BRAS3843_2750004 [Bradyrhizobium sp. STM 3843]